MSGVYPTVRSDFHESCVSSTPYFPLPLNSANPHSFLLTSFLLTSSLLTSLPTSALLTSVLSPHLPPLSSPPSSLLTSLLSPHLRPLSSPPLPRRPFFSSLLPFPISLGGSHLSYFGHTPSTLPHCVASDRREVAHTVAQVCLMLRILLIVSSHSSYVMLVVSGPCVIALLYPMR
jgi:hypothetical protein